MDKDKSESDERDKENSNRSNDDSLPSQPYPIKPITSNIIADENFENSGDELQPQNNNHGSSISGRDTSSDVQSGSTPSGWDSPASPLSNLSENTNRTSEPKIIHLIQANSCQQPSSDWVIREEFYQEDVARNHDEEFEILSNPSENEDDDEFDNNNNNSENQSADGDANFEDDLLDYEDDDNDIYEEGDYDDEDEDNASIVDNDDDMDVMENDFVLAVGEEVTSDSDSEPSDIDANYDRSLPASHAYLGDDLEESRGRQVLIEGSCLTLQLVNMGNVVFPGQTLPVTTANINYRVRDILFDCASGTRKTLGFVYDSPKNRIGTTTEVIKWTMTEGEYHFIFEGRQRFELLCAPFETAIEGLVRILPEKYLGSPYPSLMGDLRSFSRPNPSSKFNRITKHPIYIYKKYDALNLVLKIIDQIKDWYKLVEMKNNPQDFSYWMTANLPISNEDRVKSLSFRCTEARLLWLLNLLENSSHFACASCKNVISEKRDVFPMSLTGAQNSFVNSFGFIHDTLTVKNARGLIQVSSWSNQFSWFPGYGWRYTHCELCNRHIGWCYKANDPSTRPRKFYGLTRESIRLQ